MTGGEGKSSLASSLSSPPSAVASSKILCTASSAARTATNHGDPSEATFVTSGQKYGTGAVTFAGSASQGVEIATPSFDGVMTWSVWVKGTGASSDYRVIL